MKRIGVRIFPLRCEKLPWLIPLRLLAHAVSVRKGYQAAAAHRVGLACRATRHRPCSCRTPSWQVDVNVPSMA